MSWSPARRPHQSAAATQTLMSLDPFRAAAEREARMTWGTAGVIHVVDGVAVPVWRAARAK